MKRRHNRYLRHVPQILTMLLAVLILSGCASTGGSSSSADSEASGNSGGSAAESSEERTKESTAEKEDSGSTAEAGTAGEPENKEFTYLLRGLNNRETQPGNEMVLEELEKQSGFTYNLVVIAGDSYREKVNIMLASADPFDGMDMINMEHWAMLQNRGQLMQINDMMSEYAPDYLKLLDENGATKYCMDKDGALWAIPRREPHPNGFVPSIRKDWLEKLNMEEPTTMEEFEAYMEAVLNTDLNGNGQNDEIPLSARDFTNLHNFLPFFTGEFGGKDDSKFLNDDGVVMPIVMHPGYTEMLTKYREWHEKGYLYQEFVTLKSNQFNDLVIADRVGAAMEWYSAAVRPTLELQKTVPEADYIPLRCLTDPPEGGFPGYGYSGAFSGGAAIPAHSENPEAVLAYINWTYQDQANFMLNYYGIEDTHWKWVDKDEKLIEVLNDPEVKYDGMYLPVEFFMGDFKMRTSGDDPVINRYRELQDILNSDDYKFVEKFDAAVPYVLRGTEAELFTGDGVTMIEEARFRYITGEIDLDEWNRVVDSYMDMEGNVLSEVWTKQYNEFTDAMG